MKSRLRAHIGLLWLFARRSLAYNLVLSVLGASALFAVSLATRETAPEADATAALTEAASGALRISAVLGAILVMSGGQILALVAMRLFHGRELPYYRNAGLGEGALAAGAWVLALVVGGALLLAGLAWT